MSEIPTKTVPIDSLTPHPENYNQHPESQIAELAESDQSFGQYRNVVVWSPDSEIDLGNGQKLYPDVSYILAGNGYWLGRRRAGRDTIEVKDYTGLPYEDALMLMQIDNAAPLGAQPDPDRLKVLLEKTRERAIDRPKLGAMLARLRESAGVNGNGVEPPKDPGPMADKAEQLQEKWQVKVGDIFQLGRHRLICGDCRDIEVVKAVCDGQQVNGVFTSPPYAEQRKKQYGGVPTAEYVEWWEAVQGNVREVLAGDGSFFVNIKPHCEDGQRVLYVFDLVLAMVRQWGWRFVDELYWRKSNVPPHDILDVERFPDAIEYIFHWAIRKPIKFYPYTVREPYTEAEVRKIKRENAKRRAKIVSGNIAPIYSNTGSGYHASVTLMSEDGRLPKNVIEAPTSQDNFHAAAFPLALPTFFIKAYSDLDDIWLDPFAGSGTTILAAHREGRIGLGIELLPKYCAVILERFESEGILAELLTKVST